MILRAEHEQLEREPASRATYREHRARLRDQIAGVQRHLVRIRKETLHRRAKSPRRVPISPADLAPTVFVVDDHLSLRAAIQRLLESAGLRCETFGSAPEFLVRAEGGIRGCVLLDVRMPGPSGLELQEQLIASGNDVPIIFVTAYADVPLTVKAMKAGAMEVLTKPFEDQVLLEAVYRALEQDSVRRVDREELQQYRERYGTLTPREREVMALVVAGMLNRTIGETLGTAEKTIKVHRGQVMHKMEAESLAELVRIADRLGLSPKPSG